MFIVSVMNNDFTDIYHRFETIEEARKHFLKYQKEDDTYTASLSVEIDSTDDMGEVMGIWEMTNET